MDIVLRVVRETTFIASTDFLQVSHNVRYLGTALEIANNETYCTFICERGERGFKNYIDKNKKELKASDSFCTLLAKHKIDIEGDYKIFKIIKDVPS